MLFEGDQVQLDDLHFIAWLSGKRYRCIFSQDVRRVFPPSQHDSVYGRLDGPVEAISRFGVGQDANGHPYGHYDAIVPAHGDAEEVFLLPGQNAPAAPLTNVAQALETLYNTTAAKVKAEVKAKVKQELPVREAAPAPSGACHVLDSDEEDAVPVKRMKTESSVPCPPQTSFAMVHISDDEVENSDPHLLAHPSEDEVGNNEVHAPSPSSPPPLQVTSDISEQEEASGGLPVLKIRQPWLGMILDGRKVWELRPSVCSKNLGRIALGHAGFVEGFADVAEVLCVGTRVGNAFTAPPDDPQHFWLAPHNMDKHRCTQADVAAFQWKSRHLYAFVLRSPTKALRPLPYPKTPAVTWGHLPAMDKEQAQAAEACSSKPAENPEQHVALLLHARHADLVVRGQANAVALREGIPEASVIHIYSLNYLRLEGVIHVGHVQAVASTKEAKAYITQKGLVCPNVGKGAGGMHIAHIQCSKAATVPLDFRLQGRVGSTVLFDPQAAQSWRPNLHSTCNFFVDRLCLGDIRRLQATLRMLDGHCLRIASTCSGLDSCIPVLKHTLAALNERFDVAVTCSHVLSCDNDPSRQDFIRDAHGEDVGMLVADCREFATGQLRCILSNQAKPIPQADILIEGPSCLNFSKVRPDTAKFVGCLESGDAHYQGCESSTTYTHGFRDAAARMKCTFCIYENVATVMHNRKDEKGEVHPPPMEVVEDDMRAAGMTWQARVLDTQDFVLPQRRTRAWGMGTREEADPEDFVRRCEQCLVDMRSAIHVEGFWEDNLPRVPFPMKSQARLDALKERYKHDRLDHQDLFVDPHSSSGRDLEHGVGVSTCLRPANSVWSARLQRFLTGTEHLRLQGIFPDDFLNPGAVHALGQRRCAAMSFAGKAFSTTVLQAHILCLLVHSEAWRHIIIATALVTQTSARRQPRLLRQPAALSPSKALRRVLRKRRPPAAVPAHAKV